MNSAMKVEPETSHDKSLWLELRICGESRAFEFKSDELRAVAVGSLYSTDLRIDRPGVAPVQFHIEREDNALWIVPAYNGHALRVDTVRVTGPLRIDGRAVVEFAGVRIHVKLLDVDLAKTSGSLFSESAECVTEHRPSAPVLSRGELATVSFERFVTPALAKPEPLTQRFSPIDAAMVIPVQRTVVIEPIQVASPEYLRASEKLPPTLRTGESPAQGALTAGCVGASGNSSAQVTLCIAPYPAYPTAQDTASQTTTLFDVPFIRPQELGARGWLVRLGLLSRRRPLAVWLAGTVAVFVLSAAIGYSTKSLHQAAEPQVSHSRRTVMTPLPLPSGSVASEVRAPQGLGVEPVVVVPTVSSLATRTPTKRGHSNDPELVAAVGHLIAGRYTDAQAAYSLLATQSPNDLSLATVAQLLTKKLDPKCSNPVPVTGISCPGVKP